MRVPLFLATMATGLMLFGAPRAEAAPGMALVIGNSAYREAGMTLPNPTGDAQVMAAKLRARGFAVTLLTDADLAQMRAAVAAFALPSPLSTGVSHFFFYSGHGVQIDGVNYLLPVDVNTRDAAAVRASSLSLTDVLARVRTAGTPVNFVVLDACRSNPFVAAESGAAPGLASVNAVSNAFVAFSTSSGMNALDGDGRNSRFTAALAMALSDETASAQDVFRRAREYVLRTTEGAQTPDYVDTIALAGVNPWTRGVIGSTRVGQTRALISPRFNNLAGMGDTVAELRGTPAPSPDAVSLEGHVRAIRYMLDAGAQDAEVKPDYMDETYEPMLRAVLAAAAQDHWTEYDLALFLAHAAQETYQFQALAEYGSDAYFERYQGRADLGNLQPGDGARYRGRGLLQLRGRGAYARLGANPAVAFDLVGNPDALAADRALSARVSVAMYRALRPTLTGNAVTDLTNTTRALTGATRDTGLRGNYFYRMIQSLPSAIMSDGPE